MANEFQFKRSFLCRSKISISAIIVHLILADKFLNYYMGDFRAVCGKLWGFFGNSFVALNQSDYIFCRNRRTYLDLEISSAPWTAPWDLFFIFYFLKHFWGVLRKREDCFSKGLFFFFWNGFNRTMCVFVSAS